MTALNMYSDFGQRKLESPLSAHRTWRSDCFTHLQKHEEGQMGTMTAKALTKDLNKFGLDPLDWKIEADPTRENYYLLVNRKDPDFQMRGSAIHWSEDNIQWAKLSLISL